MRQREITIRFIECERDHTPREGDPNYHLFRQTKERMTKAGLLKCNVESLYHYGGIELHHSKVEYALIGEIDLDKFNRAYGLHLDDDAYHEYVEQEGNLEPLCVLHHRGQEGIHSLPPPQWNALRTSKDPHAFITVVSNSQIPVTPSK